MQVQSLLLYSRWQRSFDRHTVAVEMVEVYKESYKLNTNITIIHVNSISLTVID